MRMRCLRRQTDSNSELPGRSVCPPPVSFPIREERFALCALPRGRGRRLWTLVTALFQTLRTPHSALRTSSILFSCLLLLVLALAPGCMRQEPRADLVIVNGIEPETLDPALVLGLADMRIVTSMFEGLTR